MFLQIYLCKITTVITETLIVQISLETTKKQNGCQRILYVNEFSDYYKIGNISIGSRNVGKFRRKFIDCSFFVVHYIRDFSTFREHLSVGEGEIISGKTSPKARFSTLFRVLPNYHKCSYNYIRVNNKKTFQNTKSDVLPKMKHNINIQTCYI